MPKAFGGTRKAAPATDTRLAYGHRSARQMRQPTASAAKTKQRYKKRSNCKHKKSGCVCFIVARLRAFPCGIGTSGTTRPCAHRQIRQQSYETTQERARSIVTKTETFFSIELSSGQNAGERNKTARPSQQTRELFPSSPPLRSSPRHPIRSHPMAVRTHARARVRACSRFSIIIFTVHLLPLFHSECDD